MRPSSFGPLFFPVYLTRLFSCWLYTLFLSLGLLFYNSYPAASPERLGYSAGVSILIWLFCLSMFRKSRLVMMVYVFEYFSKQRMLRIKEAYSLAPRYREFLNEAIRQARSVKAPLAYSIPTLFYSLCSKSSANLPNAFSDGSVEDALRIHRHKREVRNVYYYVCAFVIICLSFQWFFPTRLVSVQGGVIPVFDTTLVSSVFFSFILAAVYSFYSLFHDFPVVVPLIRYCYIQGSGDGSVAAVQEQVRSVFQERSYAVGYRLMEDYRIELICLGGTFLFCIPLSFLGSLFPSFFQFCLFLLLPSIVFHLKNSRSALPIRIAGSQSGNLKILYTFLNVVMICAAIQEAYYFLFHQRVFQMFFYSMGSINLFQQVIQYRSAVWIFIAVFTAILARFGSRYSGKRSIRLFLTQSVTAVSFAIFIVVFFSFNSFLAVPLGGALLSFFLIRVVQKGI